MLRKVIKKNIHQNKKHTTICRDRLHVACNTDQIMQREFLACILASSTAVKFAEVCNQTTHLLPHSIPTKNTAIVSTHLLLEKHGAAGSYRNSRESQKWISSFCHPECTTQLCPQQPSWAAQCLCLTSVFE